MRAAQVPSSQPSDSLLWCMSAGEGSGGSGAGCLYSVIRHQPISITTITVVIFMICNARSLDSWIPWMFCHQKKRVTAIAKKAANVLSGTW